MTRLELEGVRAVHGASRLLDVDARVEGRSLCVVGHWAPLLAALAGRVPVESGSIRIDGADARQAVISGKLGVADPELSPPINITLIDWLTLNLRLFGLPPVPARAQAMDTLKVLHLENYGSYVVERFPASTLWIARVALALSTRPECVVLPPPIWVAETMALESTVLGIVQSLASVILACDPPNQPELFFAAEWALWLEPTHASVLQPRALNPNMQNSATLGQGGPPLYSLLALSQREALVERLRSAGVSVFNADGEGELWVQLPEAAGTDVLLRAAVDAQAPLTRLTPLFERRP